MEITYITDNFFNDKRSKPLYLVKLILKFVPNMIHNSPMRKINLLFIGHQFDPTAHNKRGKQCKTLISDFKLNCIFRQSKF